MCLKLFGGSNPWRPGTNTTVIAHCNREYSYHNHVDNYRRSDGLIICASRTKSHVQLSQLIILQPSHSSTLQCEPAKHNPPLSPQQLHFRDKRSTTRGRSFSRRTVGKTTRALQTIWHAENLRRHSRLP